MRAAGQSEMRQLLSTLNVHCIQAPVESEKKVAVEKSKQTLKAGWLFKKSEKKAGMALGKAWQRRWFVLEVETEAGQEENTLVKKARLTYYHSNKDAAKTDGEGVEIPLNETMGVKQGLGKTKGTEHRITLNTPKREWELGSGEAPIAAEWVEVLQAWIGLPKVERVATSGVVKAQWMQVRVGRFCGTAWHPSDCATKPSGTVRAHRRARCRRPAAAVARTQRLAWASTQNSTTRRRTELVVDRAPLPVIRPS